MKAAEQGHAWAQFNVGICFEEGKGIGKNIEEAFKWYMKAAEQGHPDAQFCVAVCYLNGEGVEKSKEKAKEWFARAAAANGDEDAKKALAKLDKEKNKFVLNLIIVAVVCAIFIYRKFRPMRIKNE